jgi:hypothetical protein
MGGRDTEGYCTCWKQTLFMVCLLYLYFVFSGMENERAPPEKGPFLLNSLDLFFRPKGWWGALGLTIKTKRSWEIRCAFFFFIVIID